MRIWGRGHIVLKSVVVLMFVAILSLTAFLVVSLVRGVSETARHGSSFEEHVSFSLKPGERIASLAVSGDYLVLLIEGLEGGSSLVLMERDSMSFVRRLDIPVEGGPVEGGPVEDGSFEDR